MTMHWVVGAVTCICIVTSAFACGGLDTDTAAELEGPRLPALCKQPSDVGTCDGYFPRWFFNSKKGVCEKFIYGGCDGNKNNFKTRQECDKTCWCPPQCDCYCEFGFEHDDYGCELCRCKDPCKGVFCPAGEMCVAKKVQCLRAPCPPVTECVVADTKCCDGQPYDHVRQICCQRRLYKREDDVDCCMVDSIYKVNKPYSVLKEVCCQGVIQGRPCNAQCCGKKAYDSLTEICCDGVLQKRPPNPACCGVKAYDSRKFVCCGGTVQERPDNAFG